MSATHITPAVRRDARYAFAGDSAPLSGVQVGNRVYLDGKRMGWTVRARDDRYVILTQPFNLRRTVLYTVADLALGIRGTDNFGGLGYESDEEIARAMAMFRRGRAEISVRNNVTLSVDRVVTTPTRGGS